MIERTDDNKEKRILTYIVVCILTVFLLSLLCKINISNIREYEKYLPNNISSVNALTIGTPRAIRSDEWLVDASNSFYEMNNKPLSKDVSEHVVRIVNVQKWGYYILPNSMAFSFKTLIMYCVFVISGIFFFRIFGKGNWLFILLSTTIVILQPAISWWNAPATYAIFLSIIDLFYYFFVNKKVVSKLLCCLGLIICMGVYIVSAYPAWMIPLGYLAVLILIGIYTQQRDFPIRRNDVFYIVGTIIAIGLTAVCYYLTQKEFIAATMNTVYPGQRQVAGGGLRLRYLAHYLTSVKMPFKDISFLNNSEASTFLSFFPIPWVVYFARIKELKNNRIISSLLAFTALTFIYARFGFGEKLSKYTLWSWTIPNRVIIIADFAMLLALLMEAYYLQNQKTINFSDTKDIVTIIVANVLVITFVAIPFLRHNQIFKYLGMSMYVLVGIAVIVVLNLLLAGKQKPVLIILLCFSIVSGATVNPINMGTDILENTPLAKEIKELDTSDSGRWITNNDNVISKYVRAQGVECLNALSYPPRFDLFSPLDEGGKNQDVYNRYAHVIVSVGEENGGFELLQDDMFKMKINAEGLRLWNVKYIVSAVDIESDTNGITIKRVYDDLDGYNIYKVSYE